MTFHKTKIKLISFIRTKMFYIFREIERVT